jgi:hypothetical protein
MGIKFRCPGCDKKLHVKAYLAGKRGVCPRCGAKVQIPLESLEADGDEIPSSAPAQQSAARGSAEPSAPVPAGARQAGSTAHGPSSPRQSTGPATTNQTPRTQRSSKPPVPDPIAEAPEAVWYVRPPTGGQFGPADAEIMRRWLSEGRVSADSLVWREGWEDWKTGEAVFPSLRTTQTAPEPVLADPVAVESLGELSIRHPQPAVPKPRGKKTKARNVAIVICLLVVFIGLLAALFFVLRGQG